MADTGVEIRVESLWKVFGTHEVLRGVDLEVRRRELVAIVGGSGCGKTVLLDHMIGQMAPTRGRVLVADHSAPGAPLRDLAEIDEESMDRIRLRWAVVFQRNALYSGTVEENISFWLRENTSLDEGEIRERVVSSLRSVGFEPDETLLQKDRDNLSGGMAKRVAVARALAMRPALLFYDEPTTGLDPTHAKQIHELIVETHGQEVDGEKRTSVLVTHDKDLLHRLRPRVVMLHEGRVHFDGTYEEFHASDSPIIRPYFDLMTGLHSRPA